MYCVRYQLHINRQIRFRKEKIEKIYKNKVTSISSSPIAI